MKIVRVPLFIYPLQSKYSDQTGPISRLILGFAQRTPIMLDFVGKSTKESSRGRGMTWKKLKATLNHQTDCQRCFWSYCAAAKGYS